MRQYQCACAEAHEQVAGVFMGRLPVNCQLIVTFFGDRPAPDAPIAAETQPVIKPVPGVQSVTDQRKVREYLQRLHVGLGHCGRAEFLQHLKDAGAATWLLRQAERFTCPLCEAQRAPDAHAVIGSARPRSFNSVVSIDTLDLTLERDSVQHRVFLLTAVDTATSFARVFHLAAGDSATAVQQLEQGWFLPYGAPEYIYCDPDTIFRSDQFGQCLARHSVVQRLSAAQAPYQHGQIERLHRTLRMQAQKVFLEERSCSPFDAATAVIQARNELMRVEGVSPSVLVFGKLPKAPPGLAEADEDYQLLAERLHREDPLYETLMLRRVAARTAWVQSEVRDRTARISATRPRPYKGPYYKGQVVLVYRRRKGDAANPGHKGVWLGPGEVVAVESTSDKLVPRVIYVTVHGRLFLCSPEQLRPVSVKAEWVRTQLQQSQSLQPTFQDMRMARGTDVRAERPTSAEWEAVHEVPDTHVSVEDLKEEADYEPLPQAPPTPVPGTPVPGTPAPGTPRPSVVAPPLVPLDLPTPAGGEAPADVGSLKRGDKRPHGEHADVELESQHRAELGPGAGSLLEGSPLQPSSSTVLRGDESRGSRARSRTPSRNPPARESSLWAFADFEGDAADHAAEAWYSESKEHDYSGLALGVEFDVDFEELENDESIRHIIKELCFDATAVHKRKAEINERYLTASEKQMFREAKRAEWSQWVANEVVELLSRRGVDPQRVISSRWVLTWKHVGDQPDGEKRAKARLVIRGFKDPDLGQYSTASPTLSRQGRHAILTIAAHHQYRLFTLDAKTAFLAGDRSSRVKPIYAELPRDLVQDQGYDEDTIARIKKVPYGLSEAPLAWYRRLTAELEACGFEQVPADRCIFVLRDKRDRSRVLGIVGAHVDDLLIAGCSAGVDSQFEEALQKLVARLPFGERKYADVAPVLYTGLNLRQHPLTKTITVDQAHYIEKLRETPLKPLKDGLLDKSGQTKFWSQLGALLWVAVNTRPDVAYDISHYASFGTRPEKRHIVALNKIVKTLQSQTCTLTFQKVAQRWEDLALVVFTDA
ncbi:RE1, partial [Symbiodinium microadriaticum]